ncbi:MAG: hypothetical protein IPK32_00715 [Verrucomicrobiaceae bacterium]|nr:hypothetical protein [Verrucomicrobiaceae bacterium]
MKLRVILLCLFGCATAQAQPAPRIGYVYPAGGQFSSSLEVSIGGQYLDEKTEVIVSGSGVSGKVLEHDKLPSAQIIDDYRDRLRDVQAKLRDMGRTGEVPADQKTGPHS